MAIVPAPIPISSVLRVLSDDRCLALLKTIAILSGSASVSILKTRSKLSSKGYYSRISALKKACLVQREEGNSFLTSFGKIVYDSQSTIANALENFWKLEAIDCFRVPRVKNKIIEILINSPRLRESIVTDADANSTVVENTSIIESNNSKSSNNSSSIISNIKCDDIRTRRIPQLRYLSILDELRYFPTSSVCNQLLRESVEESLAYIGKSYSKALLNNMCSLYGLSESELLTNYDLFETTLYKVLGAAGQSVITRIKKEMLLRAVMSNSEITVNDILNPALTVNYVLKKLQYVELFEFLNALQGGEHIALLYTDEVPKNKILCEFFRSSMEDQQGRQRGRNPIGLVSVKPPKDKDVIFNIPCKELLDYTRKFDVKERLAKWIAYVHSFNVSKNSIPTKIAEEDASLWLKSGFSADEDLRLEQMFSTFTCDHNLSILCAFDISKIDGADIRSMMKSIISAHDYVILDEPLVVYYRARTSMKANNRTCSGSNNDSIKTISIPKEH